MTDGEGQIVAGIDLGSNSFHMVVARMEQRQLHVLDRVREWVRLAGGLDQKRKLSGAAQERALGCLERFAQRLRGIPEDRIRAVGTNTLRQARNGPEFLERAIEALGHRIEVISGQEEARLVYLGVAHSMADDVGRRLVIDIGGGSTEYILGERFETIHRDSLFMGCVSYTQRYFPGGAITRATLEQAESAARRELRSIERRYTRKGWHSCIGSSGTMRATERVIATNRWSKGGVTLGGLAQLRERLLACGHVDELSLPGLEPERAAVYPGGFAIVHGAFQSLGIDKLVAASGALREGLIYDLMGRIRHEDVRDHTIQNLCATYHVDLEQAERVERTALDLLDQVGLGWGVDAAAARRFMSWAARLHEIGLWISYPGHHKHGAYIIRHADLPGFSRGDQHLLAALIRGHRRKLSRHYFSDVTLMRSKAVLRLCGLLRLAVCLNRPRSSEPLPPIILTVKKDRFKLTFPRGWLEEHPLTVGDLTEEASRLAAVGMELAYG